jgi:hypothetical protein
MMENYIHRVWIVDEAEHPIAVISVADLLTSFS